MISVYIIDDYKLHREAIKELLKFYEKIYVAGDCNLRNNNLLQDLKTSAFDIIIIGQQKENTKVIELCEFLSSRPYCYNIIVISESEREQNIVNLINAGAKGFVYKNAYPDELVDTIYKVAAGNFSFPKGISNLVIPIIHTKKLNPKKKLKVSLSSREKEIVCLMVNGKRNRQIAEMLSISKRTVEIHKSHIYRKLNTSNIADIIKYAINNNLCNIIDGK